MTQDPVKVVHVLGTLDRGGVESIALRQCRTIPASCVKQTFVLLGPHEGQLAPQFRAAGADIRRCPLGPKVTFPVRLWNALCTLRPDVVESHVSLASGLVLAAASAAGVPVRIARMRSEGDGRRDTPARRLQRALLREMICNSATDVIGVTKAALAFTDPPPHDHRYRVVPNQVDTGRFRFVPRVGEPRAWPVLGHIGRASPEKNRAFLMEVHAEARRLRPDVRLTIAGPGGVEDLTSVAPRVAADPSVHLLGHTERPEDVLAAIDVLLLPSHREGLPGVVLEALASGVPVLATELPGLRELAPRLRGLHLLPLRVGPVRWAATALALASISESERALIAEGVRNSDFALSPDDQWWRTVWTASR
ncbi:glycosyltransferase family 1 protein [Lentzea sp. PSKA42]|uniref:Glycosyltransferase family 1 protein n=1 Tax=Lentzea indica TaxID=2604800 RepID=A0ABX1FDM8_9PSEU|nr:glycosyltransferase [Lentzea indica]NKE56776.1 glycosyltransferase family 1 protein [Lentzea indica]